MNQFNDGGPAFPFVSHGSTADHQWCNGGMSLRAYIAIHAPWKIIEDEGGTVADAEKELGLPKGTYDYRKHYPLIVARRAVAYADALIAELEKGGAQ